jgi:hypothetical protein
MLVEPYSMVQNIVMLDWIRAFETPVAMHCAAPAKSISQYRFSRIRMGAGLW